MFRLLVLFVVGLLAGCQAPPPNFDPFTAYGPRTIAPPPTGSVGRPGAPDAYYQPNRSPAPLPERSPAPANSPAAVPRGMLPVPPTRHSLAPLNRSLGFRQTSPEPIAGGSATLPPTLPGSGASAGLTAHVGPTVAQAGAIGTGVRSNANTSSPSPLATAGGDTIRIVPSTSAGSSGALAAKAAPAIVATGAIGVAPRTFVPSGPLVELTSLPKTISIEEQPRTVTTSPPSAARIETTGGGTPSPAAQWTNVAPAVGGAAAGAPLGGVAGASFSAPASRPTKRYGYDPDYQWVQGELQFSESEQRWKLRYIPHDAPASKIDQFGGSVALADSPLLAGHHPGDFVTIHGRLGGSAGGALDFAPVYNPLRIARVE